MYTPLLIITPPPPFTQYIKCWYLYTISTLDIYKHVVCRWGVYNLFCFIPVNLLIKLQTPVVSKIKKIILYFCTSSLFIIRVNRSVSKHKMWLNTHKSCGRPRAGFWMHNYHAYIVVNVQCLQYIFIGMFQGT